jgi:hypothetical protein
MALRTNCVSSICFASSQAKWEMSANQSTPLTLRQQVWSLATLPTLFKGPRQAFMFALRLRARA